MRDFEKEVADFAKFFQEYRKGEEEYYENMIKNLDEVLDTKEENKNDN